MNKKSLILAASALAMVLSCNVREESLPLPRRVTFQAVLCDTPPTKTALQSNGAVYWTTGDAINIFYKDNISAKLASDSTATAASAQTSFSGVLEDLVPNGSDYFWAVYPYSGSTTYDGSSVTVTLPSEQYGTPGTFADDLFISMARSMDYTLQFYNLCGGIKFRVANQGIRLVTFAGNNSEILAGQVQATFNSEGKPVVLENLKGATTLRLHSPDDDGFEVGKWYYIVSLPATLSAGYTMTFYNASNEEIAKRVTDTSVSIKRSIWGRLTDADVVVNPNNSIIRYTSTDGSVVEPNDEATFGNNVNLVSNTYENGEGIMVFDGEVTTIGDESFSSHNSSSPGKLKSIILPESCLSIGESAFMYNTSLETIYLPEALESLGRMALYHCEALSEVELPQSLTSIGTSAFSDCTSLQEITIPQSVESLGDGIFPGCTNLERFYGKYASDSGRELIDGTRLYAVAPAGLTTYTVSSDIRTISSYVFYGFKNLTEIILPDGLLYIYGAVFADCDGLTEMSIPESVIYMDAMVFRYCDNLERVTLPSTTTWIHGETFHNCKSLLEIDIPEGVTRIDDYAFAGCLSLSTVTVPSAVQRLGAYVFNKCQGLESIVFESVSPPTGASSMLDDTNNCPIYVPAESVDAYKSAEYWSAYADRIQAIPVPVNPSKYLTFTSTGSTTISLTNEGGNAPVLYYSTDAQNWTQWDYSGLTFTEAAPLYLCGNNPEGFNYSNTRNSHFVAEGDFFSVSGDIMSLLDMENDLLTIPNENCFLLLFQYCSKLTAGPGLPATTLTKACYKALYEGCYNLSVAPELPAMTMAESCYEAMFYACEWLTTAPELPATTLAPNCYFSMFQGCTRLATASELPAMTMAEWCYYQMFFGCTSLEEMPDLPATTLAPYCYRGMFYGCTGLVSAIPSLPASTLSEWCYAEMFAYCSNLSTAPYLDAPVLAENCYNGMFKVCTSLEYLRCLATNNSATGCTDSWLDSASTSGYFIKDASMTDWPQGTSGIPSGWTVQNSDGSPLMTASKYLTLTSTGSSEVYVDNSGSNAPVLYYSYNLIDWILWEDYSNLPFTSNRPIYICGVNPEGFSVNQSSRSTIKFSGDYYAVSGDIMSLLDKDEDLREIPSDYCFYNLFSGSSNLTSAPSLPATYLTLGCYARMFEGCQSLVAAPSLPATCLSDQCYDNMFLDCQSLTTAPELPADTLATSCYYGMFTGCTSLAVAPDLPANNLTESCYAQMFVNCTSLVTAPEVLPAEVLSSSCYQGMFMGCSSLTTAPMLPAEVVAYDAYTLMFSNCTSLNYVVCLAYDIGASGTSASCVSQWMNNVAETGTFVKSPDSQWPTGDSGIPEGWTVEVMQ